MIEAIASGMQLCSERKTTTRSITEIEIFYHLKVYENQYEIVKKECSLLILAELDF